MSLSSDEVALVVDELASKWTGAQVQKVYMRGPSIALLTLRVPGVTGVLRVSVEPDLAHLCVRPERGAVDDRASAFCMLMRKLMKGARLSALEQVGDDRIVRLRTARGALVAELFGRRGRMVLCDETGRVVAFTPSDSRRTGLDRGRPYEPPQAGDKAPSPARFQPGEANEAVRALFDAEESSLDVSNERALAMRHLATRLKRQRRLVAKIEADRAKAGDPSELSRQGELLKTNMGRVRKGMSSITVDDVLSGDSPAGRVEIVLDPSLTPAENLERTFAKARRSRRALQATAERLSAARAELGHLEQLRSTLDAAQGDTAVASVLDEIALDSMHRRGGAGTTTEARPKKKKAQRRVPFRTFLDGRNRKVLVGKSAADNDSLTVRVARPDDLWLHARGTAGSHVVVPLSKGEEVDPERLIDAATLAAHFSESRGDTVVEVTYAKRRYVQKLKGLPPGKVVLLREKVLLLTVEPDRLERLLASQIDS